MYLYLLKNRNKDKYYIGITSNLNRRLNEHNQNNSHFTGKFSDDWILVNYKVYEKEIEARKEEKRLKKAKNRKYILWYFSNRATSSTGRAVPS